MLQHIRPALVLLLLLTLLTGFVYPLVTTGIAEVLFPSQADGSLIVRGGAVAGSELIGQPFSGDRYFHPRPSAAGTGYDAAASSGSNLGPTSKALFDRIRSDAQILKAENPSPIIPVDLVTTSGSGLDPHISPDAARFQAPRVARARGLAEDRMSSLIAAHTEQRTLGILGEPRVNVLKLNFALDELRREP